MPYTMGGAGGDRLPREGGSRGPPAVPARSPPGCTWSRRMCLPAATASCH